MRVFGGKKSYKVVTFRNLFVIIVHIAQIEGGLIRLTYSKTNDIMADGLKSTYLAITRQHKKRDTKGVYDVTKNKGFYKTLCE